MAAGKPGENKPKVMDVSKPGKGKIIANSRPVTAPLVSDKAKSDDVITQPLAEPETAPVMAPSVAKKVIQPITIDSDEAEPVVPAAAEDSETEAAESSETTEGKLSADEKPAEKEIESAKPAAAETAKDPPETSAEDAPKSTDSLPTPAGDNDNPIAPAEPATDQSGAASVDELAKAAESKRMAAQKTKEEQARDEKVQELINSKQYHVPIKSNARRSRLPVALVLITVMLAVAGYLMIDVGVFGKNINLPFEVFKENETDDAAADSVAKDLPGSSQSDPAMIDEGDTPARANTPISVADDEDRKNELKNLQQELETFFNDNNEYPLTLTELTPAPTTDELTGPDGETYDYKSEGTHYVLSVNLSDGSTYVLESVNQP